MKNFFSDLPMQNNQVGGEVSNPHSDSQTPQPKNPEVPMPMPVIPEAVVAMSVADIIKESMRCFTEYEKCKEHEITERKRINATLKAIEYQIDAQKEVYLQELEKNYEERNRLYNLVEKAHQKALEKGDKEMLQVCYNMILNIYSKPVGNTGGMPSLLCSSFTPL